MDGSAQPPHEPIRITSLEVGVIDTKDFSPLTLRSPLRVQGTFADPKFRLEAKPLGLKFISAVALGFINPLASIIPLIDLGDKTDGGCQQALAKLRGDRPKAQVTRP